MIERLYPGLCLILLTMKTSCVDRVSRLPNDNTDFMYSNECEVAKMPVWIDAE